MAATLAHPLDRSIKLVEESARLLWRSYQAHIGVASYEEAWRLNAKEILVRCKACEERLLKLRRLRAGTHGFQGDGSALELFSDQLQEAEWKVQKCKLLLLAHHDTPWRDDRWKDQELRIIDALKKAIHSLVDVLAEIKRT
jgi:hypothetical protein